MPPLTQEAIQSTQDSFPHDVANAVEAIISLKTDIADAHDALLASKIAQAHTANAHRANEPATRNGS